MGRYWVIVDGADRVENARRDGRYVFGFREKNGSPDLGLGDWLIFYSPRKKRKAGSPVQSFTAIGQVIADGEDLGDPLQVGIRFLESQTAPISGMVEDLRFIANPQSWGASLRKPVFQILDEDVALIKAAMGVD